MCTLRFVPLVSVLRRLTTVLSKDYDRKQPLHSNENNRDPTHSSYPRQPSPFLKNTYGLNVS